jgi:hypothetical protein
MVPLMSESLERGLGPLEYLKLRLHLLVCTWCARYFKQIKFLRRLVRLRTSMPAKDNPARVALTVDARERIAKSLRQAEPQRPLR